MSYKQLTQEQRYQIYALKQAEQQSKRKRKHGVKKQIGIETWHYFQRKLKKGWSPEQVSGRLIRHHSVRKGIARDMVAMKGADLSQTAEVLKKGQ